MRIRARAVLANCASRTQESHHSCTLYFLALNLKPLADSFSTPGCRAFRGLSTATKPVLGSSFHAVFHTKQACPQGQNPFFMLVSRFSFLAFLSSKTEEEEAEDPVPMRSKKPMSEALCQRNANVVSSYHCFATCLPSPQYDLHFECSLCRLQLRASHASSP